MKNFGFSLMFGDVTALAMRWESRWKGKLWMKTMPGPVRTAVTRFSPPKTALLIGPLYLIWTLTVVVRATMQDTSTANTSPTSRFFCTTSQQRNPWGISQRMNIGALICNLNNIQACPGSRVINQEIIRLKKGPGVWKKNTRKNTSSNLAKHMRQGSTFGFI